MNNNKIKITLVISTLTSGGAERVLVLLSKGFIERGHQVNVITFSDQSTDFYQLPVESSRLALGIMKQSSGLVGGFTNNLKRISILKQAIKSTDPDVVISFLRKTNILTILASKGEKYPVIGTEHNDVRVFSYGKFWETLRRWTYPNCSMIVSVSQGVDNSLDSLSKSKRAVIYNPIIIQNNEARDPLPLDVDFTKNWIVSMGRLNEQKGFDLLLKAFQKVAFEHPNWQLLILGKGELREQLEQIRDNLRLSGRVVFTGALENPFYVLKKAKLFVMASRHEGFPLALGEALACGLPVISTDCPSGPKEMIRHNVDGLLVANHDVSALATAIESLISNEQERQRLATKAPEVIERFGIDKIVKEWETLIQKLVAEKTK